MRHAAPQKSPSVRTEQIILFRAGGQIFAISSTSVQEVRSVDSLARAAVDFNEPTLPKVRHVLHYGERNLYLVNAAVHFGLRPAPPSLIFLLRQSPVALLIDGIEKMLTMSRLQALPGAFCHEEREWYRGLTVLDQSVIPVVRPAGFLTLQELSLLETLSSSRGVIQNTGPAAADLSL